MNEIDRRDYYRIHDNIEVECKVIHRSDLASTAPTDHFDVTPSFSLLADLYTMELEAQDMLRKIAARDRDLGSFLHNVSNRLARMSQVIAAGEFEQPEARSPARISEGGISFVNQDLLRVGSPVVLKLLFKPSTLGIIVFGEVRHCRFLDDSEDYVVGVRFLDMDLNLRGLVSRHIIRRQAEERRERLRRDANFDIEDTHGQ
ncbi:MAG: PilZ domain-containing protein [Pseudomonadales bacterium]|nr:PilZ domain-containing protein [Pseudomonadales bacterium]